ncbi:amidohydrolase family protein [bacterium]|nr:amidohydrolase family protein [bacterium]
MRYGLTMGTWAWAADRVFDGDTVLPDHAVLVQDGRVTAVVPRAAVPVDVPQRYEPDSTILPGLIDTHVHFMRWQAPLYLAYGVTTVRDTGNDQAWILAKRRAAQQDPAGPGIICVGPVLDGPQPSHRLVARSCPDQHAAVQAVRETAAAGVDGIKLYVGLSSDWLPAMVRAAHATGLKTCKHCCGEGVLAAGKAGVDEFFHLDGILEDVWRDHPSGWLSRWGLPEFAGTLPAQQRVADEIARLGMTATPTLAYWQSQWRLRAPDYTPDRDTRHVPPAMVDLQRALARDTAAADQWRRALAAAQRFVGLLYERGVRILAGTDVPCGAVPAGLSLWHELALLEASGLSNRDALRSATSVAAEFLGLRERGSLRTGTVADLVVVRGDPTQRIPAEPEILTVVRQGVEHQPADLLARAAGLASTVTEDPWGRQMQIHAAGP